MTRFDTTYVAAAFLVAVAVLTVGTPVDGRPHRVDQVPNGAVLSCATCHVSAAGGDARNPFGQTVESEFLSSVSDSGNVLWSPALASRDSDGDGFTNGTELGDPDGTGVPDSAAAVTAPGDAADFPMMSFAGASMDLTGDGNVDAADYDAFVPLFVQATAADTLDGTIDFDGDGAVTADDLILLFQNLDRSVADTTLALAAGAGPNVDVLPTLDFQTGNGQIDGVLSGEVTGEGTTFELEVFLGGVVDDVAVVELSLGLNRELVRVNGFEASSAGMVAVSADRVVLSDLSGVSIDDAGFLGRLVLRTVSDVTGVTVRVELREVRLVDAASGLSNVRAAGGIGVTANPLDSVLPDLNGDGLVDDSDNDLFLERFALGAGRQDASFDETIDFDADQRLTEEDVLLFMLNYGRSQETFTFFRSSQPGSNGGAAVSLDFEAGNFENDGVTEGTIAGDGEVFSFDVFATGIVSEIALVTLVFDVDFSEVSLFDFDPPLGMRVYGQTDSSVVYGVVTGQDASDGYLGRVDFISASDLAGIPTPVAVRRATLAEAETILTDDADVTGASVLLNEVVDDLPSADVELLAVELDSVEVEADAFTGPLDAGDHLVSFVLNAPLLDATDSAGDPIFEAGLPRFQNFRAYLLPDPFAVGGGVTAVKSVDEERLQVTVDLPDGVSIQAIGSAVPEFAPQGSADYFFGSGEAGGVSVAGDAAFGPGLAALQRVAGHPHVMLLNTPLETLLAGLEDETDIVDALASAWVRGDYLSEGDAFTLRFVPPGEYHLFGRVTVMLEGEPRVITGSLSPLIVADGDLAGLTLSLDLPLEPIEISGIVLAAIEFEGDNMFVESETGEAFEVIVEGTSLSTFDGAAFDDVRLITAGDSVAVAGFRLGPDRIRASAVQAAVDVGPASDFTGDGAVNFADFLVFAMGFGLTASDAGFDGRLDLDGSGDVGFGDFLVFVAEFGT